MFQIFKQNKQKNTKLRERKIIISIWTVWPEIINSRCGCRILLPPDAAAVSSYPQMLLSYPLIPGCGWSIFLPKMRLLYIFLPPLAAAVSSKPQMRLPYHFTPRCVCRILLPADASAVSSYQRMRLPYPLTSGCVCRILLSADASAVSSYQQMRLPYPLTSGYGCRILLPADAMLSNIINMYVYKYSHILMLVFPS